MFCVYISRKETRLNRTLYLSNTSPKIMKVNTKNTFASMKPFLAW